MHQNRAPTVKKIVCNYSCWQTPQLPFKKKPDRLKEGLSEPRGCLILTFIQALTAFSPFWDHKCTFPSDTCNCMTYWGQIVVGCGTSLFGDLWACRRPVAPVIPAPGSVDWVFSPARALLAWRSGSRADWLPKHTGKADESGWGPLHAFRLNCKGRGCVCIPVMHNRFGVCEHICHTFVASLVFCLLVHLIFFFLLFI